MFAVMSFYVIAELFFIADMTVSTSIPLGEVSRQACEPPLLMIHLACMACKQTFAAAVTLPDQINYPLPPFLASSTCML